ncbi:MAG: hypothetical protein KAT69_03180 [Candidatus Aminicenantes bacterium]|nr:hypothetical protein [Candidatus Aminicenantes bacterium]
MSIPTIGTIKNLFGKRIKFWFKDLAGRYESKGIITEYIIAENCLTVQDDKDGVKYYVGIDQVEILKEGK